MTWKVDAIRGVLALTQRETVLDDHLGAGVIEATPLAFVPFFSDSVIRLLSNDPTAHGMSKAAFARVTALVRRMFTWFCMLVT